ncbi:MAG: hypothetical protein ACWA5W_10795 [Phycisphaerales bacterium]
MSQIAANKPAPDVTGLQDAQWEARLAKIAADPRMSEENTNLSATSARKVAMIFFALGVVGLVLTLFGAWTVNGRHALGAFEMGLFTTLAISIGSLFWVLVFHSLNASWPITLRRQFENIASTVWFPVVLMIFVAGLEVTRGGVLFSWLGEHEGYNHLLEVKEPYLNPGFFMVRVLIYACVWVGLSQALLGWSRKSDETGDRTYGRKARFIAGLGIPLFAFSTTFAAFDFLMSLDYRFFSTMWGVYYFASCGLASVCAVAIVATMLRRANKLEGLVTNEHFHDLGKLVFAFTIFWAYIAFSQYFLIWYSNIPEETAWYTNRQDHGWQWLFVTMTIGHFALPFLLLIWRKTKRTPVLLCGMSIYMLLMVVMDMAWIIRPMVYLNTETTDPGLAGIWLDIAGVVGVLGIFGGLVALKVAKSPLLPIKDPMLHECMHHKNYV